MNEYQRKALEPLVKMKNQELPIMADLVKHTVTISGVLIALVFALVKKPDHSTVLYDLILLGFLFSILSGTAVLYTILASHRKMYSDLEESIRKQILHNAAEHEFVGGTYYKLMKFFERVCVLSFLIGITGLTYMAL